MTAWGKVLRRSFLPDASGWFIVLQSRHREAASATWRPSATSALLAAGERAGKLTYLEIQMVAPRRPGHRLRSANRSVDGYMPSSGKVNSKGDRGERLAMTAGSDRIFPHRNDAAARKGKVVAQGYAAVAPRDASAARQNDIVAQTDDVAAQNDAVVRFIDDFVVPRVGTRCPGGRHQRAKRRFRRSRQRGRRPDSRCRSAKPRTRLFGRRWRGSLQGRWCFAPWRRCAERQGSAAAACRQVRTWLVLG